MATLNTHGIIGKEKQLLEFISEIEIDITFITETWTLAHPKNINTNKNYNISHVLGNRIGNGGRGFEGLALIYNAKLKLSTLYTHPSRLFAVWQVNHLRVIGVYLPPRLTIDAFQTILGEIGNWTNNHCVILGDFNARCGSFSGDLITNERGNLLLTHANRNMWKNNQTSQTTVVSNSVVDYIFLKSNISTFKSSAFNAPCTTDHRMVISVIKPNKSAFEPSSINYTWKRSKMVHQDFLPDITKKLLEIDGKIINHIHIIKEKPSSAITQDTIDEFYQDILETIKEKFKNFLYCPSQSSNISKPLASEKIMSNHRFLQASKDTMKSEKFTRMGDHFSTIPAETAEDFNSKLFVNGTNTCISACTAPREALIPLKHLNEKRIRKIVKGMANQKAMGTDNICIELFKVNPKLTSKWLSRMLKVFSVNHLVPSEWRIAKVRMLYKKGDPTDPSNYRPIACTSHLRKIWEMVTHDLLVMQAGQVSNFQGGFRPKRSALDQCLILHEIIREYKKNKVSLSIAFLDIRKAYDTVNRNHLWNKLTVMGVTEATIWNLRLLFENTTMRIHHSNSFLPDIQCSIGLMQGASLSPTLYNYYINDIGTYLSVLPGPSLKDVEINLLAFADDMVVIALNEEDLQFALDVCSNHSNDNYYEFSPSKCVTFPTAKPIYMYNIEIPTTDTYTYLGIIMDENGINIDLNIESNIVKAKSTMAALQMSPMSSWNQTIFQKGMAVKAFVRSKLEYGNQIMNMTAKQLQIVDRVLYTATRQAFKLSKRVGRLPLFREVGMEPSAVRYDRLKAKNIMRIESLGENISLVTKIHMKLRTTPGTLSKTIVTKSKCHQQAKVITVRDSLSKVEALERAAATIAASWWNNQTHHYLTLHDDDILPPTTSVFFKYGSTSTHNWLFRWLIGAYPSKPDTCQRCHAGPTTQSHLLTCITLNELIEHIKLRKDSNLMRLLQSQPPNALLINWVWFLSRQNLNPKKSDFTNSLKLMELFAKKTKQCIHQPSQMTKSTLLDNNHPEEPPFLPSKSLDTGVFCGHPSGMDLHTQQQ